MTSSCAQFEIPIANRAPLGPLALISPANTYPGFTRPDPDGVAGAPGIYYPTAARNYLRLVPPDDVQGAGQAVLAKQLGLRRVLILSDDEEYGDALARGYRTAAAKLGASTWSGRRDGSRGPQAVPVLWQSSWTRADGVLVVAGYDYGSGALIRALRSRYGSRLVLLAGDGFLLIPDTLHIDGLAAKGMYVSVPSAETTSLTPHGRRLLAAFERDDPSHVPLAGTVLPETIVAAEIVLDAIARSDGSRASVLRELRATRVTGCGLLGSFHFDAAGDMTPAPIMILRITGVRGGRELAPEYQGAVVDRTVRAPLSLLRGEP